MSKSKFRKVPGIILSLVLACLLAVTPLAEPEAKAWMIENNVGVPHRFLANFMYEKKIDMRKAPDRKTIPNADFEFELVRIPSEKESEYGIGQSYVFKDDGNSGQIIRAGFLENGEDSILFSRVSFKDTDIFDAQLTRLMDNRDIINDLGEQVIDHILKYDWGEVYSSDRSKTAISRKPTPEELERRRNDTEEGYDNKWPDDTIVWMLRQMPEKGAVNPGSYENGDTCYDDYYFGDFKYSYVEGLRAHQAVTYFPHTYRKSLITHQEVDNTSGNYISLSKGLLLPHEYWDMLEYLRKTNSEEFEKTFGGETVDGTRSFDRETDADSKELYVIYRYLLKEKSQENSPFVTNNDVKIVDFIPERHILYMFSSIGDANTFYSQAAQEGSRIYSIYDLKEDPSIRVSFTNEYKPKTPPVVVVPVKRTISVTKRWEDEDNRDNKRPESVTIQLLADGKETGKTLVLNADNGWSGSFTDLPKEEKGSQIQYTVKEVDPIKGYVSAITGDQKAGFTITNTYETEKISLEGKKIWKDNNNADGKRPESITIRLLANGVEKESRKVTEKEGWKWTFSDLPKFEKGKKITYTIAEDPVENYTSEVKGYDVINTRTSQKKVPNKPTTPNKPNTSSKSKSPKTGDTGRIYFWTSILLISCLVLLLVKKGKLRKTKSDR